jgi:hypothetical protein
LKFLGLLFLIFMLRCEGVNAAFPNWHVKPSVCVTQMSGNECTFTVIIDTQNLSDDEYCLYLQEEKLQCFASNAVIREVAVTLTAQSTLALKDSNSNIILSHTLSVKSMAKQKYRQRIRSPWSLF